VAAHSKYMTSIKNQIPDDLRQKLPSVMYDPFFMSGWVEVFGLLLCICALYGPLVGQPDHNGLLLLFGPLICPWGTVIYYYFVPFSPFRGMYSNYEGKTDLDKRDADARQLVEIYHSKEAQRFLIRTTLKLGACLFVSGAFMAFIFHDSLSWSIYSRWCVQGALGCCIGAFVAIPTPYMRWGLMKWVEAHKNIAS
jgi:hypothetical protein